MSQAEKPMTPLQALDLISNNIARLTGTRNDHAILLRAEQVIRETLIKSGNGPRAVESDEKQEGEPIPAGNA